MSPDLVAPLVVYLSSDEARDVSGQVFGVRAKELMFLSQSRPLRSVADQEGWTPEKNCGALQLLLWPYADDEWERLKRAMGGPAWADDPRFVNAAARRQSAAELDRRLAEWTRERDRDELVLELQHTGIKAGPVLDPADLPGDRHLKSRGFFQIYNRAVVGPKPYPGAGLRLSKTPMTPRMPAPMLGEHNDEILSRVIGLTMEEIEQLRREEIIDDTPAALMETAGAVIQSRATARTK